MAQLNGQQQIDVNAATVKPVQTVQPAKPTAPKKEELHYEPGKALTEDQLKKMTNSEKERYFQERDSALDKKCAEGVERRAALKKKIRAGNSKAEEDDELEESEDDDFEEEDDESPTVARTSEKKKKRRRRRNVCKKHGIKPRELKRGVETARAIFVPKLAVNKGIPTKVLIAIIDLLENGDIL